MFYRGDEENWPFQQLSPPRKVTVGPTTDSPFAYSPVDASLPESPSGGPRSSAIDQDAEVVSSKNAIEQAESTEEEERLLSLNSLDRSRDYPCEGGTEELVQLPSCAPEPPFTDPLKP